jgi:hypothetical protein
MNPSSNTSAPISVTLQSEAEALLVQHTLALYRDSKTLADDAPHGQFLNVAEAAVCEKGRELLRVSLQTIVQEKVNEVEKKTTSDSVPNAEQKKDIAENQKSKLKVPPEP